jgi:hypothetical protein
MMCAHPSETGHSRVLAELAGRLLAQTWREGLSGLEETEGV